MYPPGIFTSNPGVPTDAARSTPPPVAAGSTSGSNALPDVADARADTPGNSETAVVGPTAGSGSAAIRWQWPHPGDVLQGYQADRSRGIDIAGKLGDPVLAAGAGEVAYSGRAVQGSGDLIIIRHDNHFLSAYAHNRTRLVAAGARVRAGQQIAELGVNNDGEPVLHFEIRRDGTPVDPQQLLPFRRDALP